MSNKSIKCKYYIDSYLLFFLVGFAFLTMVPYISWFKQLNSTSLPGIVYRAILLFLFLLFFTLTLIISKPRLNIYIWIAILLYLLSGITTVFVSPVINDVRIDLLSYVMGFSQVIIITITAIAYLTIPKQHCPNIKSINVICIIMVFFGVLLTIYSYIFQSESIYHTLFSIYGWNYDVTSIFAEKTMYGYVLFICSLFAIVFGINNKQYWSYLFSIYFLFNMFISRSKTSILCTFIILSALFFYHLVMSWNIYKKCWILFLAISTVIVIVLSMFLFIPKLRFGVFNNMYYFFTQVIIHDGIVVMEDRILKWSRLFSAVNNPYNFIFGYGERIAPQIISKCSCATIGDSIYVSNYAIGGLVKSILYLLLAIYVITNKSAKKHKMFPIIVAIQISILVGGLFEDDSIIGVTTSGFFSSILYHTCNKIITDKKNV